ncbi:MAG: histidine kinase [Dysgonomonas sp.]
MDVWSQSSAGRSYTNQALQDVANSLENGDADYTIARGYMRLVKNLVKNGEYAKAEEYLGKIKKIYVKYDDKVKIAETERELAKVQEAQNKLNAAMSSYDSASKLSQDKTQAKVNANDVNRLKNASNPAVQSGYIQQNINLLKSTDNKEDKVAVYQQMAKANLEMDNMKDALKNLNTALASVKDKPEEAIKINREIANVYASNNDYQKAIDLNEKLVQDAKEISDPKMQIEQLQLLSNAYFAGDQSDKGVASLREAYSVALKKGYTLDAKKSLELLADYYKKEEKPLVALRAYESFLKQLEPLIESDSSLVDAKYFQVHERKIVQLEKDRALKDELIEKKNILNSVLIGSIVLISIFLGFMTKTFFSIKKKNKKIALQSLRREMNPHFIFNSLNSVNQFIAQNNELEANKYLSSYSKLMRTMMENSNKDFVPLSTELLQLTEYLDLEYMRFKDKFSYEINVDDDLDTDAVVVPNMLIQPQLENAIWHGLRYTESGGFLSLSIATEGKMLSIKIEDNGIGLKKSKELKTVHQKSHNSRGLTNTYERISLLNNIYDTNISIQFIDKEGDQSGVIVILQCPLINKK